MNKWSLLAYFKKNYKQMESQKLIIKTIVLIKVLKPIFSKEKQLTNCGPGLSWRVTRPTRLILLRQCCRLDIISRRLPLFRESDFYMAFFVHICYMTFIRSCIFYHVQEGLARVGLVTSGMSSKVSPMFALCLQVCFLCPGRPCPCLSCDLEYDDSQGQNRRSSSEKGNFFLIFLKVHIQKLIIQKVGM